MAEDYIRIYQQLLTRSSTQAAAWNINNCSGRLRPPISPTPCPPLDGLAVASSALLAPCSVPSFRNAVLFFKKYRSNPPKRCKKLGDSLRSGNIAALILVRGRKVAKWQWNGFRASLALEAR